MQPFLLVFLYSLQGENFEQRIRDEVWPYQNRDPKNKRENLKKRVGKPKSERSQTHRLLQPYRTCLTVASKLTTVLRNLDFQVWYPPASSSTSVLVLPASLFIFLHPVGDTARSSPFRPPSSNSKAYHGIICHLLLPLAAVAVSDHYLLSGSFS